MTFEGFDGPIYPVLGCYPGAEGLASATDVGVCYRPRDGGGEIVGCEVFWGIWGGAAPKEWRRWAQKA